MKKNIIRGVSMLLNIVMVLTIMFTMIFTLLLGIVPIASAAADSISIESVTPNTFESYDKPVTFMVNIKYTLQSVDKGVIYLGFNTATIDSFKLVDDHAFVSKGSGTITLQGTVKPVAWGTPDSPNGAMEGGLEALSGETFEAYVNISTNPHPDSWEPLATDDKELTIGDSASASTEFQTSTTTSISETTSMPSSSVESTPTPYDNRIILGKDNNSFIHTYADFFSTSGGKYTISNDLYDKLVNGQSQSVKNEIKAEMNNKWDGSCQGISSCIALAKVKDIDINNFDADAGCMFNIDKPKDNPKVRDMIDYYQLAQLLPNIMNSTITAYKPGIFSWLGLIDEQKTLESTLYAISEMAKTIKFGSYGGNPFLIMLGDSTEGHCVVASSYSENQKGDHIIEICDPNDTQNYIYMTIAKDYSTWSLTDANGTNDWTRIGYLNINQLGSIDIDGSGNSQNTQTQPLPDNETQLDIGTSDNFNISDTNGDVFGYSFGSVSGDLKPSSVNFINNSTINGNEKPDMILKFPQTGTFDVSAPSGDVDTSILNAATYTSVTGSKITSLKFNDQNGIDIKGNKCDYSTYVSYNSGNDCNMICLSGHNGNDIDITQSSDGILMKSDNLQGINLTSFGVKTELGTSFSTSKKEVLIKDKANDTTGIVQVLVSSKDNGVFDQVIKETGVTAANAPKIVKASSPNWAIILIAIVFVILIGGAIIIIVILRSKGSKNEAMDIPVVQSSMKEPVAEERATSISNLKMNSAAISILSGSMKGTTIPIKADQTLNLGKDPKISNVVFSNDYERVSRLHCTITYSVSNNKYFVVDCSHNGTYTGEKTRLEKGKRTPMNHNTILLLADASCSILLL